MIAGRAIRVDVQPPAAINGAQLVSNAFVESALVHTRALAYFLAETKKEAEVKARDYEPYAATRGQRLVDHDLATFVRTPVLGPVSNHVAHSKYAGALQNAPDQHPGRWPIPELAVVLVDGVAGVVKRLGREASSWFAPSPVDLAGMIEYRRTHRTVPSEHPDVRKFTLGLAARLDAARTAE